MIREEYGHSYRQCPVCKKESLPSGVVVCCQNKECYHVIHTGKEPWVDTGPYYQDNLDPKKALDVFIYAEQEEEDVKPTLTKYQKIYQFVYSLSQQDMVILEQVIKDKRRRYGGN